MIISFSSHFASDTTHNHHPRSHGKLPINTTARLEKTIANEIVTHEVNIENDVSKKLNTIIESHITTVQKQKRVVAKCHQDNEAAKQKYQVRLSLLRSLDTFAPQLSIESLIESINRRSLILQRQTNESVSH